MTTNKPGSIGQRPLYGCTSCYEEASWPAEDLRVHENECWCEICWEDRSWDFTDQPRWGDLDTFTPRPAVPDEPVVHIGFTNPHQIFYAQTESGSFYPDIENECHIPVYMLKRHINRLGHDFKGFGSPFNTAAQQPEGVKQSLTVQNR